jgi:PAS domain S-box-containing protein
LCDHHARLKCKDGSIKYVLIDSSVLWDNGQFVHTQCFTRDITEGKRAEQRLAVQYAVSRVLVESQSLSEAAPAILETICRNAEWDVGALWVLDKSCGQLRCLELWNRPTVNIPQFRAASLERTFPQGTGLPGQVWAERRPAWFPNVTQNSNFPRAATAASEGLCAAMAFPIALESELFGVMEFFSRELRQTDEDFLEMLNAVGSQIGQFIERKRAAEALRASEERYRSLVSVITDVPWTTDGAGEFTTPQLAWAAYTGQPWEEHRGFGWLKAVHPDDRESVLQGWNRACEGRTAFRDESRLWHAQSGAHHYCAVRAIPMLDSSGNIREWVGSYTDVDDQRQAAEKLEQAVLERTASLREVVGQMEEFSYTVSHDLRAPLRGMQTYSKVLLEDFGDSIGPEGSHYLQRLLDNANRLDKMILDILTFSRVARAELRMENVSLDHLVRELLQYYPAIQAAGAEIHIEPLLDVFGHEPSLTQAVSNLVGNAVKFVHPGVKPKIRIWTEPKDNHVRLWVEDNGIGIDPKYQHRLFSMFERVHPHLKHEGTGVGLAVVRKAAERMGGKAGVESNGTSGSRFWIEVPGARETK